MSNPVDKSSVIETEDRPHIIYFGLFFDGTGNNIIQQTRAKALKKKLDEFREEKLDKEKLLKAHKELELSRNGANSIDEELVKNEDSDFSNIAALHGGYIGLSREQRAQLEEKYVVKVFNIYIQGAGTNEVWTKVSDYVGSGFGLGRTGVVALVTKAIRLVDIVVKGLNMNNNLDNKIYFDVFGFSRGATCARMFAHYVNGDLSLTKGYKDLYVLKKLYLTQFKKNNKKVSFLGIFDTVSSIGINYDNNNIEYGLYSPNESWVEHTCHICALDEFRDHFRLTDVGDSVNSKSIEIYLPGCHSDIGGGYKSGTETMRIRYGLPKPTISFDKNKPSFFGNLEKVESVGFDISNGLFGHSSVGYGKLSEKVKEDNILPLKIYNSMTDGRSKGISANWLNEMGWYDKSNSAYNLWTDSINHILNITRPIERGYSNIPLAVMKNKAMELTGRDMFDDDNTTRFSINIIEKDEEHMDMKSFYKKINETVKRGVHNGSFIITPDKLDLYRQLRSKYLHFSASDSLIVAGKKTSLVNAPTIENFTLNRVVYKGNIENSISHFLYPNL